MSDVVENISEQQNSAPSIKAAQPTEVVSEEISNNVVAAKEAVPAAIENVSIATLETAEESLSKPIAEGSSSTSPKVDNKKTPAKRTPTKRMSFIERAQKESEELVRTLGGSLELEGGRRTRSSTRGTPTRSATVSTPPPPKKSRNSPASGASTPTRRGRGRKLDTTAEGSAEEETSPTTSKKKTPAKGRKPTAKNDVEGQLEDKNQHINETEKKSDDRTLAADTTKEDNVHSVAPTKPDIAESKVTEVLEEIKPESNTETKDEKIETENNVNEEEAHKVEDEPDIVVLEPVLEETQSQVTAETSVVEENITKEPENVIVVEKNVEEPIKNYSPMETEEESKPVESEKNEKQKVEPTIETNEIKEPTPEPMEVDSNSKSNDDLEKMEETTADVVEQTQLSTEVENSERLTNEVESQQSTVTVAAEPSSTNANNLNNVNKVEENIQQTTLVTDEIVSPASDSVELNSIGAKLVNEPAATNAAFANENSTEESTTPAANDSSKTENDLCEPKIATSPPISAANDNSTVTTPQTCN
ncbi:hypothetical protein DOY81_002232 [Sarcophaga bullata]|nr:hypothetical protein DOY81_002232 [Sarcophaga bullata]